MINKNDIKGYLKKYIKQGIDRFVIYPFGENGMNVKNILKEYFDIIPILIVDNEYAKFNSSIVDGEIEGKIFKRYVCYFNNRG